MEILHSFLIPSFERMFADGIIFQDDNVSGHRKKMNEYNPS